MEFLSIGLIAQTLTSVSGALYLKQTIYKEVKPIRISWFIWAIIGCMFAIVAYNDPKTSIEVFAFSIVLAVFPTLIAILSIWKGITKSITKYELIALVFAIFAITLWWMNSDNSGIISTLILIVADACALIPTLIFVYSTPKEDKPIAWICFASGSIITLMSLSEYNIENIALPTYMAIGSLMVAFPLIKYRVKNKINFKEWY